MNPWSTILAVALGVAAASVSCKPDALAGATRRADADRVELIRIGMMASLFDEKDDKEALAQMQPFAQSIKQHSGVDGEFVIVPDAASMARLLKEEKLHLGILHGVEYGWLKAECPECRPVLVAVNETPVLTAHLLVPTESAAKAVSDLKGKNLVLPRRTLYHTRLYLERLAGEEIDTYFQVSKTSANVDEALDAVVDGKADATAVGNVALETYRQVSLFAGPARFTRTTSAASSRTSSAPIKTSKAAKR
jgi:ABC-type phosphate/phosphonate transport system substrate-binding protein